MDDPWAVLGVDRGASEDEIRAAYRRLAARHHPDVPGGDERRMAEINTAYAEINAAYATLRDERVMGAAAGTTTAPRPVQHAGSTRSYGCGLAAAIALVIAAVTVAVAVAMTRDRDRAADVASSPAVATTSTVRRQIAEPAPWTGPRLDASTARLAVSVWQRSPARAACPLLVPAGADVGGTARVVDTAGGWGVAWGQANEADLFGVTARPGARVDRADGDALLTWSDGSRASLRRDGDRLVADLSIAGIGCGYEVFSTAGFDNLAEVLGALRFVET